MPESKLLIKPDLAQTEYLKVTPQSAGWEHLSFTAVKLTRGETRAFNTDCNELALVILGGTCDVHSSRGDWHAIGSRTDVFHGLPTTLYLPRDTRFVVKALSENLDFACGWAASSLPFPPRLVRPEEVNIELRGGENASRQINQMIPPGFTCQRLVVVEVYTPSGNWSSYPPHKHDERKTAPDGTLLEADLEEIYFYKIDRPEGYAYQRIYTDDRRLDELILVQDSHLVLSPEGYHPVVSAPGYNTYYLNILAGSDQSLAASDDPAYAWVKDTWKSKDARLPLVTLQMNHGG
ncbi:MAG TPA: 5-deoxy-glucuronate isomerase [Anaerolineaceae bacterium]|nr:5-deoxy-glucuronate isomerase [Anaerolineaceae bacterium]